MLSTSDWVDTVPMSFTLDVDCSMVPASVGGLVGVLLALLREGGAVGVTNEADEWTVGSLVGFFVGLRCQKINNMLATNRRYNKNNRSCNSQLKVHSCSLRALFGLASTSSVRNLGWL